jgi:Transglycosylase SLT domain
MLVDSSNSAAGSTVTGAIRQASAATGTSFNYLLATAQVESGLNPQAGASTSSARGLFQFVDQTWLGTMKDSGPALGYGRYAAAITRTASGHYQVNDPVMRSEILKLRNDPTANAVMAGAFTKANASILASKLGRAPSEGELYIAHFLGAGGAARLISLAANNPSAKADEYFPFAARANTSIFYDRTTGSPRTLAQVRDTLTARYDVARSQWDGPIQTSQAANAVSGPLDLNPLLQSIPAPAAAAAATIPDTAGIANAFAAATEPKASTTDGQGFRGLFQDTDRPAPLASTVSELWGAPKAAQNTGGTVTPPPASGGMLDLFKDKDPGQSS